MTMLFSILIPLVFGIVIPALRLKNRTLKYILFIGASLLHSVATIAVIVSPDSFFEIWKAGPVINFALASDNLSRVFAAVVSAGFAAVSFYTMKYMEHDKKEDRFIAFYLLSLAMLTGAVYADNLITFYLFFELTTLASMPLVLQEMSRESVSGALKYLFYSIAGAFMALFGIFVLASHTLSLSFIPGGTLDVMTGNGGEALLNVALLITVIGFGTKAGLFPMHGWLPTAHPVAPAPASALLSGIIAKAGVIAVIRVIYYIAGADYLKGTWVQTVLLSLALFTVFMGSMMAYREKIFKKRLAYSTVSQISYILFGVFLLSPEGVTGALLHVIFHATVKIALFLCAGAMIHCLGITRVDQFAGVGRRMPIIMWCYTLVSITLIGIPPTSGFVSKWYLATASLDGGLAVISWLGPVILLISALLTAGYLLPITVSAFFPGRDFDGPTDRVKESPLMWIPIAVLAAVAVLFGIFSEPIVSFCSGIAVSLF